MSNFHTKNQRPQQQSTTPEHGGNPDRHADGRRRVFPPNLKTPTSEDLEDLDAMYADPRTWWNLPGLPDTDIVRTRRRLDAWIEDWERDHIGYWIARTPSGMFVGAGGIRRVGRAWNLRFWIMPGQWHHGYATYIAEWALKAARHFDGDAPVFMNTLSRNHTAHLIADRLGFVDVRNDFDAAAQDDAPRRIYADRPVTEQDIIDYLGRDIRL
nr:GNAT family N-acetyltransferase [Bifidobacterium sp. CP2]